ncbi:YqaA family protein [Edaphobacter flagellatus]|uniref:YqaA family protein n=1 Tax=Edaphobacter flagellatus TaxID=1933044 RepID=UPI0021B40CE5|nr:VTT domain-containing protein [Edaphobacter flagellatus]
MKISPVAVINKWSAVLLAALKPFGVWGIGALAVIDSAAVPLPIDALLIYYVVHDRPKFVVYCFMAALGSAVGSLLPFFIGRAGGELFLMKRINRKRYEQLRDRFERQEFLALMIPAMMPPPMPVKLFEFAAGVFEMKTVSFFLAIMIGKFIRFLVWALITIFFGPTILHSITQAIHAHTAYVMGIGGILVVLLAAWVTRKLFDRKRGTRFPAEEEAAEQQ